MSDTVIHVENLSKKYVLGKNGNSEGLRHVVHDFLSTPLRWLKKPASGPNQNALESRNSKTNGQKLPEEFWALKNVSFEIKRGEVVGIIGRNGAGKSTLLKILSRITEQTEGRVEITGRVASLLEVGTGFHPELTGRENIFLNGAILGMGRAEIKKKFDEIVAFAEVEKFLDTPVKRYSSGMYVRLAFAVAAHLEPEILIVDEVLAVGDLEFQKKCLGKMQDVSKGGRTILFVSHNMAAVRSLCDKSVFLAQGQVVAHSNTYEVVAKYLKAGETNAESFFENGGIKVSSICFIDEHGEKAASTLVFCHAYTLSVMISCATAIKSALIVSIINDEGVKVASINSIEEGCDFWNLASLKEIRCFIKQLRLMPGQYSLNLNLCDQHNSFLYVERALRFTVEPNCLPNASWAYNGSHGVFRLADSVSAK
jgi:lipopolysaccharide transport system ATP-binding protein